MFKGIDFYSDTVSRPSQGMRKAMCDAEVGDEQMGEDPTTRKLEDRFAEILGLSSALFLPSATMANQIAIRSLTSPGDELLAAEQCHLFFAEAGGPAIHSGVMVRSIKSDTGIFTADDVKKTFRYATGSHYPVSKLLSIENTANMGGGIAWPLDTLKSTLEAAKALKLSTHLDGSRIFNAAVAREVPVKTLTSPFNTVTVCLSKGLGCPMGAILGFDKANWVQVRRLKQLMGGAMRQSGIVAAAGLYALDNNVERLAEDHANAKQLAERLSGVPGIRVENHAGSTNMVFFHWESPRLPIDKFLSQCQTRGVRFSHAGDNRIRAVTHLDIRANDIETTHQVIKEIASS